MAVEKQAVDFEVEQNKKRSENVDVAQEKALTEGNYYEIVLIFLTVLHSIVPYIIIYCVLL
ncbi:hypothetical protein Hanom_Chr07g00655211 [Helianthus anomalus]